MAQLRVDNITNQNDDGPVTFSRGITGPAEGLIFKPTTTSFSPVQLATNVGLDTSIQIGFNQTMEFSGIGTIRIREGSATGTITTSFTCGVSTEANFAGQTLTINPKNDLEAGKTYYVTLPSTGIANTFGTFIEPITNYQFQTAFSFFDIQGGDFAEVVVDPNSPTGYYKYNIFTSSGIATFTAPSAEAVDFDYVLVGGGGGGGSSVSGQYDPAAGGGGAGGFIKNRNSGNLPAKSYNVTIGNGGSGCWSWPTGTSGAPSTAPYNSDDPNPAVFTVVPSPGGDSQFGPTPVGVIVAFGGGAGGHGSIRGNKPPTGQPYNNSHRITWSSPNTINLADTPAPSHPNWSPAPLPPTPSSSPYPTTNWAENETAVGGAPGGSGGGHSGYGHYPPNYWGIGYTRLYVAETTAVAYPSPTQQGYPGGGFNMTGTSSMTGDTSGSGGGGAGGAGGTGGTTQNTGLNPAPNASGGTGLANPEFPGPGMLQIPGFPIALSNALTTSGYLAGGGGGGRWQNGNAPYVGQPQGGNGGGGNGYHYDNQEGESFASRGLENTGGGGGGGAAPGGPTGVYPTPAPGSWWGQNGGSGVMMFRYAHPGTI